VYVVGVHEAAERDAQQLLDRLDMTGLPVDPIRVARKLGARVWTSDLGLGVSGVLVKKVGSAAEIYLNTSDHPNRQRFTAAHEVGHLVKRVLEGGAQAEMNFVDYRDDLSSTGTSPSEMYANGFAAALLMPARHVRDLQHRYPDAEALAYRFEVSSAAMRNRLRNLGLQ
jgi:predicted transcriptional regulator